MTGRRGVRKQATSTGGPQTRGWFRSSLPGFTRSVLTVWRSWQFIGLALGDAVLIVIDVFAIAYAPKHVSGSECALIGLLENILAPLWVFARFGDVPSAWTVAGGALLLATLIGHEVAAREPVRVSQPGARGYRTVNNL